MVLHVKWYYMLPGNSSSMVLHVKWYFMFHGTTCYMVLIVKWEFTNLVILSLLVPDLIGPPRSRY